jgi:hypothetical protein
VYHFAPSSPPGAQLRTRRGDPYAEDFRFEHDGATQVLKPRKLPPHVGSWPDVEAGAWVPGRRQSAR